MTTMSHRLIPMTDTKGRLLQDEEGCVEPLPGSVVLTDGAHGTAWQLFFTDGRWHSVRGGGSKTWAELLLRRNLVLIYDAPERADRR